MKLLIPLLLFSIPAFAQSGYQHPYFPDSTQRIQAIKATQAVIDRLYQQQATSNHFPGMVYGVLADGKLVYTGTAGFTNVEKQIPAAVTSAFRIASMSKSFTAMAILQLRDAGRLQLDEPAYKYIPELKKTTLLTTDAPPVTIRHLLTHAAGFPEDNPWGDRQLDASDKALLQLAATAQFSTTPGTTYEYSNVGFALLGRIVTVVGGMPYQQYITQKIIQPLGMMHTYWEYSKVPPQNLAHGYRWVGTNWQEEALLHDGAYGAMGGLITTLEDFAIYMSLHLQAWPPRNEKENGVIKRSSLREMQSAHNFSLLNTGFAYSSGRPCALASAYGYGLRWIKDCEGKTFVGHTGGLPGFGSNWNVLPEYGVGVVCFANVTYAPTANFNLSVLDTLVKLAHLKPFSLPASPVLLQRKEQLLRLLPDWKNAEKSGAFAVNFFKDYPVENLRRQAIALFEKTGSIVRVHDLVPLNNLRGSFIMEGQKAMIRVFFTLTPEPTPLIQELRLEMLE